MKHTTTEDLHHLEAESVNLEAEAPNPYPEVVPCSVGDVAEWIELELDMTQRANRAAFHVAMALHELSVEEREEAFDCGIADMLDGPWNHVIDAVILEAAIASGWRPTHWVDGEPVELRLIRHRAGGYWDGELRHFYQYEEEYGELAIANEHECTIRMRTREWLARPQILEVITDEEQGLAAWRWLESLRMNRQKGGAA